MQRAYTHTHTHTRVTTAAATLPHPQRAPIRAAFAFPLACFDEQTEVRTMQTSLERTAHGSGSKAKGTFNAKGGKLTILGRRFVGPSCRKREGGESVRERKSTDENKYSRAPGTRKPVRTCVCGEEIGSVAKDPSWS